MITRETLLAGLVALDLHPRAELTEERMIEVIGKVLDETFDVEFECPGCSRDLPETERCFYCGLFFDGVEDDEADLSEGEEGEGEKRTKYYEGWARVDCDRLLAKLTRFFAVDEVRRGNTVSSFWAGKLGVLFKAKAMNHSLKLEFPYRAELIAHHRKLGIEDYSTPRHGYPSRVHIRALEDINPTLLEALTSVKAMRAREKITAPQFRSSLEREALRRVVAASKRRRKKK